MGYAIRNQATVYNYHSYEKYLNYVESGKNKEDRPIANNTRVVKHIGNVAIKLHNTEIVIYYKSGLIELNSGGWRTVTTKDRMNTFSPIGIYTDKRIWYVTFEGKKYLFEDNMLFNPDNGEVFGADRSEPLKEFNLNQMKEKKKELQAINNYVKAFIDKFLKGEIGNPGPGDCWYCLSHIQGSGIPPIQTLNSDGTVTNGFDESNHIKSHINEKYYVPSLLYNAIENTAHLSMWDREMIARIYNKEKIKHDSWLNLTGRNLRTTLARYIRKQLGYHLS